LILSGSIFFTFPDQSVVYLLRSAIYLIDAGQHAV